MNFDYKLLLEKGRDIDKIHVEGEHNALVYAIEESIKRMPAMENIYRVALKNIDRREYLASEPEKDSNRNNNKQ